MQVYEQVHVYMCICVGFRVQVSVFAKQKRAKVQDRHAGWV